MENPSSKSLYCYCHFGGEATYSEGRLAYHGGFTRGIVVTSEIHVQEFVSSICGLFDVSPVGKIIKYSLKFDKNVLLQLENQEKLRELFNFNDEYVHVYVVDGSNTMRQNQESIRCLPTQASIAHENDGNARLMVGCASTDRPPLHSKIWENEITGVGQKFESPDALRHALFRFATAMRFRYKFKKNCTYYISVQCVIDGCPWKLTACCVKNTKFMVVRKYIKTHKHTSQDQISMLPIIRSNLIVGVVEETVKATPDYLPRQICKDFQSDHGISLNYHQAWRCKDKAKVNIDGNAKDSYKLVPWMCNRLVDANPGTIAKWTESVGHRFHQLFISYHCSIQGFNQGCRPIIFIDAGFMSGPYKGCLLSATGLDANDGMFPIAYGIVSSENIEDWLWFLQSLKSVLDPAREVIIVSDRNQSILTTVRDVFGAANNSHCFRHVKENFSTYANKFKLGKKGKDNALSLLNDVAYARVKTDFDKAMINIKSFREEFGNWVEINGPEHWANYLFPKKRWDRLNTNVAESFNAWMRLERQMTILKFITANRQKLTDLLLQKRGEIDKWTSIVSPKVEEKLHKNIEKALLVTVRHCMENEFEVETKRTSLVVDLSSWTCTCKEWQMTGIPCAHACAVIRKLNFDVYDFVEHWYRKETQEIIYSNLMHGVPTHDMPSLEDIDSEVQDETTEYYLYPPKSRRQPGRPRQKRIESQFMDKRPLHCSRCKECGHNRAGCQSAI